MRELDNRILCLHEALQDLFAYSVSLSLEEKRRSKQLFADLWLMDTELLQFLDGVDLPEWTS